MTWCTVSLICCSSRPRRSSWAVEGADRLGIGRRAAAEELFPAIADVDHGVLDLVVDPRGQVRFLLFQRADAMPLGLSGGVDRRGQPILTAAGCRRLETGRADRLQVAEVVEVLHAVELEGVLGLCDRANLRDIDPAKGRTVFAVADLVLCAEVAGFRIGLVLHPFAEQLRAVGQLNLVQRVRPEDAQAVFEHDKEEHTGQGQRERQRRTGGPNQRFALRPEVLGPAARLQYRPYFFRKRTRTSSAAVFNTKVIRNRRTCA